jgi:hypothetical protein
VFDAFQFMVQVLEDGAIVKFVEFHLPHETLDFHFAFDKRGISHFFWFHLGEEQGLSGLVR